MHFCYNFIMTHPVCEIMCGWVGLRNYPNEYCMSNFKQLPRKVISAVIKVYVHTERKLFDGSTVEVCKKL